MCFVFLQPNSSHSVPFSDRHPADRSAACHPSVHPIHPSISATKQNWRLPVFRFHPRWTSSLSCRSSRARFPSNPPLPPLSGKSAPQIFTQGWQCMLGMLLVAKSQRLAIIICFLFCFVFFLLHDIYLPPLRAIILIYVTQMFYFLRAPWESYLFFFIFLPPKPLRSNSPEHSGVLFGKGNCCGAAQYNQSCTGVGSRQTFLQRKQNIHPTFTTFSTASLIACCSREREIDG